MDILLFLDKQLDASLSGVTWLKACEFLQRHNNVVPIAGFKKSRPQFPELRNDIVYLSSPNIRFIKRIWFYGNQITSFKGFVLKFRPTTVIFNTSNFLLLLLAARSKKNTASGVFLMSEPFRFP